MRALLVFAFLVGSAICAPVVRAQCVGLADLLAIGAEPTALTSPKVVTDHLTFEWTYIGPTATVREAAWTFVPSGGAAPTARLQMRAQRPGQDVVLKTTQANCVRELNRELKSRKLTAQPVTCPSCEAVRYQGPDFEATIYSQMKGEFPFVIVVHQVPPGMPAAASGTGGVKAP
ncbi:MAG: Rhodanese-related sulfurtransferase [Hymenobacter sp.]|nr:Rhodanese-related sulfurtransferase [Hymenobacter sp.]